MLHSIHEYYNEVQRIRDYGVAILPYYISNLNIEFTYEKTQIIKILITYET